MNKLQIYQRRLIHVAIGKIFVHLSTKNNFLNLVWEYTNVCVDKRWMPVEEVRAEDGQGQPLPQSVLSLHNGSRMPRQEAGIALLPHTTRRFQNLLPIMHQ
jgi:hypothetical protein